MANIDFDILTIKIGDNTQNFININNRLIKKHKILNNNIDFSINKMLNIIELMFFINN